MDNNHIERKILIGMIVSTEFLTNIYTSFKPEFLVSKASKAIAKWCLTYYDKYKVAPKEDIEDFLESFKRESMKQDEVEDYIQILDSLSSSYDEKDFNVPYLTDQAFEYFGKQSIQIHIDNLNKNVKDGNLIKAKESIDEFSVVEKPQVSGVDIFDEQVVRQAFHTNEEYLFGYKGDMGDLLNDEFYRESYICILAPAKTGKTTCMMEFANTALSQGCKVAYFQAGDLSQDQFAQRFYSYINKTNTKEKYCQSSYIPVPDCKHNQTGDCVFNDIRESKVQLFYDLNEGEIDKVTIADYVESITLVPDYNPCTVCHNHCDYAKRKEYIGAPFYIKSVDKKVLTPTKAIKQNETKFDQFKGKFRLYTYSSDTLTPSEIGRRLDEAARINNFVPDVVLVDYVDIMRPDGYGKEGRDRRNSINIGLRRISQDHHCCLISATQADTEAMDKETLSKKNFNEDRRVLDHVTCMLALNQTDREKSLKMIRLTKLITRSESNDPTKQLVCLQNLDRWRFVTKSFFRAKDKQKD